MNWNWQQENWPNFKYDSARLEAAEATFLKQGGMLLGAFKHLNPLDEQEILTEAATSEAMTTSAIEGEVLDRQSVRSSIQKHLGIQFNHGPRRPLENGVAEMTVEMLRNATDALSNKTLWNWHNLLFNGQMGIETIGSYRTHAEPMQIVSGRIGNERVYFEAPPSERVSAEMERFIDWFNSSEKKMAPIARSGIAHIYFESIHPFEDGNGRIGRAISEKALAQGLGQSCLTMLSTEIQARQNEYYNTLEQSSSLLDVTGWLAWYADVVLAAQRRTQALVDLIIAKTRLLDRLRGNINERQEKALVRMFREGPSGFSGGMSSGNYQKITGASPATAGRDLTQLVELNAIHKTGEGKGTRYWLKLL
jgi:Fic family protein